MENPTSFDELIAIIDALTGTNILIFILAVLFIGVILAAVALQFIKTPWYRKGVLAFFGLASLLVIGVKLKLIQLIVVALLYCTLIFVIWAGSWLDSKRGLEKVVEFADPAQSCYDEIKAFSFINRIQTEFLTCKQLRVFNRYRVFCHIALGNCNIAKLLLNEGDFEPALKHFALGVIANDEGDYRKAAEELNIGFAAASDKTDPFIILQMEHNRAIEHINNSQFRTANDELEKVRLRTKLLNNHNKQFLNLLYVNLLMNKTRLDPPGADTSEEWALIDEYADTLDLNNGTDRGVLFNLKLMFLRQLGAEGTEKSGLFTAEVKDTLADKKMNEEQRAVAMASLARIAWSDGLDPSRILEYFGTRDLSFKDMKPENRVLVFKNLFFVISNYWSDSSYLKVIQGAVASYLNNGLNYDLDAWENSLPAEAIKKRALILKERAALCQLTKADLDQAMLYLKEAIALLEQGLQIMDALEIRWDLAKTLIPSKPEDSLRQLSTIEERLAELGNQPSLGYPYFELSLCYGLLGMSRECRAAFLKAISFNTAMDHYSPSVRRDVAAASFCARFYLLLEILSSPERLTPYLRSEEGKEWLNCFPEKMNVLALNILLGRFFGYIERIPVERKMTDIGGSHAIASYWISVPELGLVFDPCIKKKDGQRGSVFLHDGHPLVSHDSNYETLMQRQGFKPFPLAVKPCDEGDLNEVDRIALKDILEALDIACKHEHPTTEELLKYYHDGCEDIRIDKEAQIDDQEPSNERPS